MIGSSFRRFRPLAAASFLLAASSLLSAQTGECTLSLNQETYVPGDRAVLTLEADPGLVPFLFVSLRPGAVDTSPYGGRRFPAVPESGRMILKNALITCDIPDKYVQALLFDPATRQPVCLTNEVFLEIQRKGFCEPVECAPCDGKVDRLTLQYTGRVPAKVDVFMKKESEPVFSENLAPGQRFTLEGTDKKGTLGTEITLFVNGSRNAGFHTSCSEPIGPGSEDGRFRVLAGSSRNGGDLCPIEDPQDPENPEEPRSDDLCEEGRARCLTFVYRGNDCAGSLHDQGSDVACAGTPNFLTEVIIMVTDRRGRDVFFHDTVSLGEPFTIDGSFTRSRKVAPTTVVEIFDLGGNLLQEVRFHTSCSQPLRLGDRFGAVELVGYNECGQD